jgi:hypothetical protein
MKHVREKENRIKAKGKEIENQIKMQSFKADTKQKKVQVAGTVLPTPSPSSPPLNPLSSPRHPTSYLASELGPS